jgi:hypothetical protein
MAKAGSALAARRALRSIGDATGARTGARSRSDEKPAEFEDAEYELIITNPGSQDAFSVNQTVARSVRVGPDSSASIRENVLRSPTFSSTRDRADWRAAGKPAYASGADHAGATFNSTLGTGDFSFAPQGDPVTFRQARGLPVSRRALIRALRRRDVQDRGKPTAAWSLYQYGFLLGTAPLSTAVRKALLAAVAALPGIHLCDALFANHGSPGDAFCVAGDPTDTEVLVNPKTGVVSVVAQRLYHSSPLYPNVVVGALVGSDTFSPEQADS